MKFEGFEPTLVSAAVRAAEERVSLARAENPRGANLRTLREQWQAMQLARDTLDSAYLRPVKVDREPTVTQMKKHLPASPTRRSSSPGGTTRSTPWRAPTKARKIARSSIPSRRRSSLRRASASASTSRATANRRAMPGARTCSSSWTRRTSSGASRWATPSSLSLGNRYLESRNPDSLDGVVRDRLCAEPRVALEPQDVGVVSRHELPQAGSPAHDPRLRARVRA